MLKVYREREKKKAVADYYCSKIRLFLIYEKEMKKENQ
jgi:hypothetical protein